MCIGGRQADRRRDARREGARALRGGRIAQRIHSDSVSHEAQASAASRGIHAGARAAPVHPAKRGLLAPAYRLRAAAVRIHLRPHGAHARSHSPLYLRLLNLSLERILNRMLSKD